MLGVFERSVVNVDAAEAGMHRSFVGKPSLRDGFHCLRMTAVQIMRLFIVRLVLREPFFAQVFPFWIHRDDESDFLDSE